MIRAHLVLLAALLSVPACSSVCRTDKKALRVIEGQARILEKIRATRKVPEVRGRIQADSILSEQEQILTKSIDGILKSQVILMNLHCPSRQCQEGQGGK